MWISYVIASHAAAPIEQERPAAPNLRVSVSASCGQLTLTGADVPTVRISGTVDDPDDFAVDATPGAVSIDVRPPSCARLTLRVPRAAALSVETMSAPIRVEGISGPLELESVSGSLSVESDCVALEAETISGAITARGAIPRASLSTVSGNIVADRLGGTIELETVSGSVRVAAGMPVSVLTAESVSGPITAAAVLDARARVELESHSGCIVLAIPQASQVTIDAETASGRIASAFGATGGRELWATLGSGAGVVTIETFSGPITISRLEP